MFERFNRRARRVVTFAQEEARGLKHDYIGTEHILLGLLRDNDGVGARVLQSLGLSLEGVREQVVRIVGSGEEATPGQIPFTPRAKKVLELALREALSLDHPSIGSEHILLGLTRETEGVAIRVLRDFDTDSEKIRNEVVGMLSEPGYRPPASPRSRRGQAKPHEREQAQVSAGRRFDEAGCRVLELALADALRRGDQQLTPESLLAGLAGAEETVAAEILRDHGLDAGRLDAEIDRHRAL